jgi:hypothetical protein
LPHQKFSAGRGNTPGIESDGTKNKTDCFMNTKLLLLIASTSVLAVAPAMAGPLVYMNTTTGAGVFNRPTEAGDALSDIGGAVPFFAQSFTVSQSGGYNFSVTAGDPNSFDTFVHLYSGSFNPASPLSNLVSANDDANGNPMLGSALFAQPLVAGNIYVFVVDGFGNSDFGDFTATISGIGDVTAVPEPGAFPLVASGCAALCFVLRRRVFNA